MKINLDDDVTLEVHVSHDDRKYPCALEINYPDVGVLAYLTQSNVRELQVFLNKMFPLEQ